MQVLSHHYPSNESLNKLHDFTLQSIFLIFRVFFFFGGGGGSIRSRAFFGGGCQFQTQHHTRGI